MKKLIKAVRSCDGQFCEDIAIMFLGITTIYMMALSVTQTVI